MEMKIIIRYAAGYRKEIVLDEGATKGDGIDMITDMISKGHKAFVFSLLADDVELYSIQRKLNTSYSDYKKGSNYERNEYLKKFNESGILVSGKEFEKIEQSAYRYAFEFGCSFVTILDQLLLTLANSKTKPAEIILREFLQHEKRQIKE